MKPVRKNNIVLIFLSLSIVFFGCSKEKVPEETLIKVYVENVVVEETYSTNSDSLQTHRSLIFSKYKITEKDFQNELEKYANDKTKWESFFKKANDYLNDLKKNNAIK
ncbi:MAG: DUF4296 domain-containing protein [Ignavibacteriales bacterium]|nr:MAG: DUF4296 domain-containing protein [Ignavibacteriales bacterium]